MHGREEMKWKEEATLHLNRLSVSNFVFLQRTTILHSTLHQQRKIRNNGTTRLGVVGSAGIVRS